MIDRIVDHGHSGYIHAVKCVACDRFHGPLFICDSYTAETKLHLELALIRHRRAVRDGTIKWVRL